MTTAITGRAQVVNGLHPPIRDLVLAVDQLERTYRHRGLLRDAIEAVFRVRDAYVDPLVDGEEGR